MAPAGCWVSRSSLGHRPAAGRPRAFGGVRVPEQVDRVFRRRSATDSGACRPILGRFRNRGPA